jgi:hypothetical protein
MAYVIHQYLKNLYEMEHKKIFIFIPERNEYFLMRNSIWPKKIK